MEIAELLTQWDTGKHTPFKGELIDKDAYDKDPNNIGCMCAQGQVLHLLGGWDANRLMRAKQAEADKATAELLGISKMHAVLLRLVNDSVDGSPSIVLTHPEQVLGDQAQTVLAFWRHLDAMSVEQWSAARDVAQAAERAPARATAWDAAEDAAGYAARDAGRDAAWYASRPAAGDVAWVAARDAAWATNEIQGAAVMRAKGQAFFFLPLFGFADPQAII